MTKQQEYKDKMTRATFCRLTLFFAGFITKKENEKIRERQRKFQDKHRIEVTKEELQDLTIQPQK